MQTTYEYCRYGSEFKEVTSEEGKKSVWKLCVVTLEADGMINVRRILGNGVWWIVI
jgi:hypothetical protein